MIVEYIILLALVMVILTFLFPAVREIMGKMVSNISEDAENIPVEPKTAVVKEIATDTELVGFLQFLGVSIGILFLVAMAFITINLFLDKKTANDTEEEKGSEEPTLKVDTEGDQLEEKQEEKHVPSENVIEFDKLPQNLFALVQDIQNNTALLLAHYEIKKDTYNIHELKRIQENELVELTRTYLNLSEKQQTRQESFLHKALIRLQKQVNRHKTKLEKEGQIEFSHAVRLVEKRYEE